MGRASLQWLVRDVRDAVRSILWLRMPGTSCLICDGTSHLREHGGSWFRECTRCGYAELANSDSAREYWGSHDDDSGGDDDYWVRRRRHYFDSALQLFEGLTSGRRLVDVGGGIGFFAERAIDRGWDAYSLDVSPIATRAASSRLGVERAVTSLSAHDERSFDLVTMWCVIAHTTRPDELARVCASYLRPGGVCWVTTPNFRFQKPYASIRARLGRRLNFAADDHVGHFTPAAATRLMRNAGLIDVRFHFRGITETCVVAGSSSRVLVEAKRMWNLGASQLVRLNRPGLMSELQVTARRP